MKAIRMYLPIVALLLVTELATGQTLDLGVKTGLSWGSLRSNLSGVGDASGKTGWHVGLFARTGNDFYFQPELNFAAFGSEFRFVNETYEPSFRQLNLPLMAGYKIIDNGNMNLRVSVGPEVNMNVNKAAGPDATEYKRFAIGGLVNAGVDIGRMTVDARYSLGLTDVHDQLEQKTGVFSVSIGFKIL
ncbi:porin family protein [Parapedobacter deserti]|uniref:Porin family protein n=1 Tax=Parapedobacter deserti TaxID=1912957 RepID=A0ABV7JS01_9SPHI